MDAAVAASLADSQRSMSPMPQLSPAGAPLQSPTSGDFHQAALASFLNAQDIVDPAEAAMSDDEWEHPQDPHQPGTSRGILRKGQRGGGE